jgi:hypothetical protein
MAWLTLAVVVTGATTAALVPRDVDRLPRGFESPLLALQLPRDADEATLVLGPPDRRAQFRRATVADLPFIAASTTLWTVMARGLTPALAALPIVAGVANVVEDVAIFAALDGPRPGAVTWIRRAALTKWLLLGATFIALGAGVLRRTPENGWDVVAAGIDLAYLYAGVLCVIGVVVSEPVIERGALPLAAAVVTQLALTVLRPSR